MVGCVVLVREDGLPRQRWPLGMVKTVFPGKDGQVRSVTVKTVKGTFNSSVQLLHDLEIGEPQTTLTTLGSQSMCNLLVIKARWTLLISMRHPLCAIEMLLSKIWPLYQDMVGSANQWRYLTYDVHMVFSVIGLLTAITETFPQREYIFYILPLIVW